MKGWTTLGPLQFPREGGFLAYDNPGVGGVQLRPSLNYGTTFPPQPAAEQQTPQRHRGKEFGRPGRGLWQGGGAAVEAAPGVGGDDGQHGLHHVVVVALRHEPGQHRVPEAHGVRPLPR